MAELPVLEPDTAAELCCAPIAQDAIGVEDAAVLATMFKAVADPVRLRLLSIIATSGESCVCDLPELVDRSQPTVSHHLKVLAEAGLLQREQRGRWAWYRVDPDRLAQLRNALG